MTTYGQDGGATRVHDAAGETFAGLTLRLRGRTGLTQRDIATKLGIHVRSVQLWEAAASHPNARRLEALIELFLESDAFADRLELEEAEALWTAASTESARLNAPFDAAWFTRMLHLRRSATQPLPVATSTGGHHAWGNAPDVERFFGRAPERATLRHWVLDDHCRVIGVLGMGGIGKTLLATRIARDVEARFEHVYWRGLHNAPSFGDWLAGAIGVLSPHDPVLSAGEAQCFDRLLEVVRESPSLLILDNFETVLQSGERSGEYLPACAGYGRLLKLLAETPHQSCVLLTGREEPPELGPLKGSDGPVRALSLAALTPAGGRELLRDKSLAGNSVAWAKLVEHYGGNGLALKIVGETIRELFGGNIADFLTDVDRPHGGVVGGVGQLLESQIQRLSELEQRVLRCLAVEREPVTFAELSDDMATVAARGAVRDATMALLRRSLLERREPGPTFLLQPVVLEYVTGQLNTRISDEIARGDAAELREQPLLKATARDHVRRSQERLILQPIVHQLTSRLGSTRAVEEQLGVLLDRLRCLSPAEQQYGPGNVVNLLRILSGDVRRIDLSALLVRQAYLQDVEAQDASLAGAHLVESTLPEAFHNMCVALSRDGLHMVTGTSTGEVCLRRASDRALLLSTRGHAGSVWRVGLSPDERLLVTASEDGTARVWQASSGEPLALLAGHTDFVQGVAVSDNNLVATAGQDEAVKIWRANDGVLLHTFESPDGGVLSVALSRDATLLVGGTRGGSIAFWDVPRRRLLETVRAHVASVPGLALRERDNLLATASLDGTARLWDLDQRRPLAELSGHGGGIWNVRLAASGQVAATAGDDGTVRIWSTHSGELLSTLTGHRGAVWDVALNSDGTRVASAGQDGSVRLSDSRSGAVLGILQGHSSAFWDVALSADGRVVAGGSQDGTVTLWNATTGDLRWRFREHTASVAGVALSDDGGQVASASQDGSVRVWDANSRQPRCTLAGHSGTVWDVALSGDGRIAASSSYDGTVNLWDARGGALLRTLRGHTRGVRGVALNDAAGLVVSGSQDGSLVVWRIADGRLHTTLRGHTNSVQSVAIDAAGHLIASAGFDGVVKLWDATEGVCTMTLPAHSGGALCVALSRDGRLLVTGGFDRTVKLWATGSGEHLATLTGHTGAVWGVSLDAAADTLASGSFDGTIRLWSLPVGTCRRTLQVDRPFERVNITGLRGLTAASRAGLMALGAIDHTSIETLV